jgi:hypothetical protein
MATGGITDYTAAEEGPASPVGYFLKKNASVDYPVSPENADADGIARYPGKLITNTTRITVSPEAPDAGGKADIYLYNSDDANDPIQYATISAGSPKAVFTNLTSARSYYVGIALDGENTIRFSISG